MTNREALQAQSRLRIPPVTLDFYLVKQELDPDAEYNSLDKKNVRGVDLALAGVILFVCFSPKSIKELDFALTQHDIDDLLRLRTGLLRKHGVDDEMSQGAVITDISDRW